MNLFRLSTPILAGILLLVFSASLYAAPRQRIESALDSACKDLRISIATEERIASDLAKLKKSGDATPDVIEDYEFYLSRVQAMVAENRKVVAKMEALNARYDIQKASDGSAHTDNTGAMVDPAIPEEQVVDEVAALDRQLDSSLTEFDGMLLKELDLIRAKSSERMRDLAEEAAEAAERLRDEGIEIDADFEEESGESEQDSTKNQKADKTDPDASETVKGTTSEDGEENTELSARDKSREGVEGSEHHPRNRFDPRDDDIVARQLREAAEEETDPELRKKLWKEYEQYKKR
ncbi:MAG: hypothetical protein JRI82_15610 [Deltaproteobacteria bacterium]|nr:hypothetical protein [Deltaproteobacteria bacterium]